MQDIRLRLAIPIYIGILLSCASLKHPSLSSIGAGSEYLGNNQRTGYVPMSIGAEIPASPILLWTYNEKHPPRHAWKEPNREVQTIDFDYASQAAISHGMVFFGSSADHKVYALDLTTGTERWHFYTEGPIRFAPVIHGDSVYVASDDGCLYCLEVESGKLIWVFRGGPRDDKLIGNEQMISHWPARSGVLIDGDKLYVTFGMWSRDGVFIYCLDPEDGTILWKNDTSGFHFMSMPHAEGFGGVAPQGYLLLHKGVLVVPTGRGAPAFFDAQTGELLQYENGHGYKPHHPGGSWVMAWDDYVIVKRRLHHTEEGVRYEERDPNSGPVCGLYAFHYQTGEPQWSLTDKDLAVARGDMMVLAGAGPVIKVNMNDLLEEYPKYYENGKLLAFDQNITEPTVDYVNMGIFRNAKNVSGSPIPKPAWMSPVPFKQWATDVGRVYFLLQAGNTVLAGGRGKVSALDYETGQVIWQRDIDGNARGICAADGRFIVSSTKGKLYCYGSSPSDIEKEVRHEINKPVIDHQTGELAKSILQQTGIEAGYCLMLGAGDGKLMCALAEESELVIYCLESDRDKISRIQKMLDDAGLLGVRAAMHYGSLNKLPYNPYFANLIIWGDRLGSGIENLSNTELYRVLRPYGGVALQLSGSDTESSTRQWLLAAGVPEQEVATSELGLVIKRGRLPGAGEWTHPHANVGRTRSSEDKIAKMPLGLLWWGGPGPARVVSRHWRAPVPLFANGILYVQGQHDVFAVDAYNGMEMWNRHLENVGRFPPSHRGGNIIADEDSVYCLQGLTCIRLDSQTGTTRREYVFPLSTTHTREMDKLLSYVGDTGEHRVVWEYLGLSGDYLIGTLGNELDTEKEKEQISIHQSRYLFVFNKHSGKLLWVHLLERAVCPGAIVADEETLYLLDRTDEYQYRTLHNRSNAEDTESSLKALDLATGDLTWENKDIPLQRQALMLKDGVIVAVPNPAIWGNIGPDTDNGVSTYSASDGNLLWQRDNDAGAVYYGRGAVIRNTFIVDDTLFLPWAYDLRTGKERLLMKNPLTDEPERFRVKGKNFCGTVAAGEDIVTFRSASVGFQSISEDSGAYWLPEVKPSCWISVIPAGGIVLAPEGYSTCICPYNYKTSLTLVPIQRNEDWSIYLAQDRMEYNQSRKKQGEAIIERVKTLRVNFNAPGDRMDSMANLWMAYPRTINKTRYYYAKALPIEHEGQEGSFLYNSDYYIVTGTQRPWLYTSGLKGHLKLNIQMSDNERHTYKVRLHFAEVEDVDIGERVFNIEMQGKTVISALDIVKEADRNHIIVIKECNSIETRGSIAIELLPREGSEPPLICAMEIIEK